MAGYQLSDKADADIDAIYEYSILNFGLEKAQEYFLTLHDRFCLLADNPSWGVDYTHIKPGLHRYEHVSHAIYYQQTDDGVLIVRVLGSKQEMRRHI